MNSLKKQDIASVIRNNVIGTDALDHLGIVAATVSKLGIVEQIDKLMPMPLGAKTTYGQRVFASILNGLGFLLILVFIYFLNS